MLQRNKSADPAIVMGPDGVREIPPGGETDEFPDLIAGFEKVTPKKAPARKATKPTAGKKPVAQEESGDPDDSTTEQGSPPDSTDTTDATDEGAN